MSGAPEFPVPVLGGYPIEAPGSWPRDGWTHHPELDVDVDAALEAAFDPDGPLGETHAVVIVHRGTIVAERYGGSLASFVGPPTVVTETTPLLSWSMAKTMLAILVGTLVDEGRLDLDAPAAVPEWQAADDERAAITLRDLLAMRDGLDFHEDYVLDAPSDVVAMLFGEGAEDMAHFAASHPLAAAPGSRYNYSSGTSNIVSRLVGEVLGGEAGMRRALDERLFGPLGMRSAVPTFDPAGTFVASSYVHATARDFAKFGLLLCRGGIADGQRLVSEAWIDQLRTPLSFDEEDRRLYSLHTWVAGDHLGTFWCNGYEGQRIVACPPLDLVIVRLGRTVDDATGRVDGWWQGIVDAVEAAS
jgi:CubicO group peptidase (beta-lactamase class C family)